MYHEEEIVKREEVKTVAFIVSKKKILFVFPLK